MYTSAFRLIATVLAISGSLGSSSRIGSGTRNTVTLEDIRDAILQVVNVVRTTEDKLERHEYRERVLGEQVKKGLISIDKRIKLLEPFKGTINRLDQRLAAVETILMQKDDRERIQLQKTFDTVEDIQKNLPVIVEKLKADVIAKLLEIEFKPPPEVEIAPAIAKEDLHKTQRDLSEKIDKATDLIRSMEKELKELKEENRSIRELNNKSSENLDKVKRQLSSSEQLLSKYENKLAEYNNVIPQIIPDNSKDRDDWHPAFLQAFEAEKAAVAQISSDVKGLSRQLSKLPDKHDLDTLQNATVNSLQALKPDDNTPRIVEEIEKKNSVLLQTLDSVVDRVQELADQFATGTQNISTEIENLGRVEQVMVQTADSVLDTKRRVEYGVHQVIAEMQQLIKANSKDVQAAIGERFDTFEMSVLDEDTGALANLTAKIAQEIDQVWRQIGIMHQQMSASTDTLTKLQNHTDVYVSGSLNDMDNMKGKVGTMTTHVHEIKENLNDLVMKLSFISDEFNRAKSGLSQTLDEMRKVFKTVNEEINTGPGPHAASLA